MPRTSHLRGARRLALLATSAVLLLATPAIAEPAQALHIAAGPLDAALVSLVNQTGQQLLYPPEIVAGRRAPALNGRYTPEEALTRLLAATDIVVSRAGPKVIVLRAKAPPPGDAAPGAPASERTRAAVSAGASVPRPFGGDGAAPDTAIAAAPAASDRPPPPRTLPTDVDEVTVTGSHLRGVRDTPSPVLVLDRAELERTGQMTVAAALAALPQNFAGNANDAAAVRGADRALTNTGFGTGLSLRGLGADATLVLVNGRRMAGAGAKGDFADISTIPTAAVERVEVLLDGASALYGSDAVAGVVNVILRRSFEGAETQVSAGLATRGEPFEGRFSQSFGGRWAGGSALLTYEHHRRDALALTDRPFSASADLRPFGGTDRRTFQAFPGNILRTDPATGATVPGWAIPAGQSGVGLRPSDLIAGAPNLANQNAGLDLSPAQARHSLYAAVRQALGPVQLLADARYGYRRFRIEGGALTTVAAVTRSNPYFVSPTNSALHQVAYSFVDELPPTVLNGSSESLGASLGAEAPLPGGWRADGYLAFAQEIGESRAGGLINASSLLEATGALPDNPQTGFSTARDGFFNPFVGTAGANSPAILAFVASGFSHTRTRDQTTTLNLKADGELFQLPGGPLRLAAGAQVRREAFLQAGASLQSGVAPTTLRVDAERSVTGAFAELRAPLVDPDQARPGLERLELSLAGRWERYDDFGETTNPKLGLIWSPGAGFTVRASYGRSFRAPALRELQDAERYSPTFLPIGGGARVLTLYKAGGNPDLEPETASSWTAGIEARPVALPGLRLQAGWFRIAFSERIDQPASQNLVGALTDPTLAPFVTRITPATNPADRTLIQGLIGAPAFNPANGNFAPEAYGAILDARYVNTSALTVQGVDVTGDYATEIGDSRLAFSGNLSWLTDYRLQITPTSMPRDLAGTPTWPARFRGRLSADWSRGDVGAMLAVNHAAGSRDATARVDAFTTLDLQLRATGREGSAWDGVRVLLTVRNLLDTPPPFYDAATALGFDPANAEAVGRFVSIQLSRAW